MSLWSRISDAISALRAGESLASVFDALRSPPDRSVAFTIAVIALGAKMAKADGHVTRDEVTAFREVFYIAPQDETHAARVFNLARKDVAGFQEYAKKITQLYGEDAESLHDLLQGLFHIAMADGEYHPREDQFLEQVSDIFGLTTQKFHQIRAQFVADAKKDPYDVLGVVYETPLDAIRRAWRDIVKETHPDRLHAKGVPPEAIKLANARLMAANEAWDSIQHARRSEFA